MCATASRSCGLTVRASPRVIFWMACSRTPIARATLAEPWPITWSARSRSRVPPASSRARKTSVSRTARMAAAVRAVTRPQRFTMACTVITPSPAASAIAW